MVWKALLIALLIVIYTPANAGIIDDAFINEFHYDNSGRDKNEFVEIITPNSSEYDNYLLQLINGGSGASYREFVLVDFNLDATNPDFRVYWLNISGIQNGPNDGLALISQHGLLTEFLSYEGEIVGTSGIIDGMTSIDIGVSEPSSASELESLQRFGQLYAGSNQQWQLASATPGDLNNGQQADRDFGNEMTGPIKVNAPGSLILLYTGLILLFVGNLRKRIRGIEFFDLRCKQIKPDIAAI